jgi:hypothetical protein
MQVGLLTLEQKNSLVGQLYLPDLYFNPVEDKNSNWIISTEEMYNNTNPNFIWVSTLPLIEWVGAKPVIPSPSPSQSGTTEYVGS